MTKIGPYQERLIWGHETVRSGNTALTHALDAIGSRGGRVLEVGCGVGRFIRTVGLLRPDLEPHGSDLGPKSVRLAAGYHDGVRYTLASATALPYADSSFETVILFDVLEHIPGEGPTEALSEVFRILKPRGVFHALVPCEKQPGTLFWLLLKFRFGADLKVRHGDHIQRFDRTEVIRKLTVQGFLIDRVRYSMHPIGQAKDILTYVEREPWFRRYRLGGVPFKLLMLLLWVGGWIESSLLAGLRASAAVVHVTATKP